LTRDLFADFSFFRARHWATDAHSGCGSATTSDQSKYDSQGEDMTDRQGLSFVSGLLLVWLFASTGVAQRLNHDSYLGKAPPELTSQPDHWLGWHEKVTLADLRGKVIWLQFNF